jgi:rfaE bifunctional protein kinase chain/domain
MNIVLSEITARVAGANRVVFVSGNFNVIHPGHLRLLSFARECGDFLLVGVTGDGHPGTFVPQRLRLEGVQAISTVDYAIPLPGLAEDFVAALRPHVVVKGKEHESHFNPELPILESYGGKLIFGSGEVRFSSLELLQRELRETNLYTLLKPVDFQRRHGFDNRRLVELLARFSTLRVVVVGDLIVDEYVACDPLGMSREDPTIVVTPIKRDRFIGGAGIVAAHAAGLGAKTSYFGVTGNDEMADFALKTLLGYGVRTYLFEDESRPTTLKQRYRASGKTLLRVSQLRQHEIGHELINQMLERMGSVLSETDLVVFSDFNYGCLPQALVDELVARCVQRGIPMVADSQSSSQVGDVSRFPGMLLITPTEHEARLAMRDHVSGLSVLANTLQNKSRAKHVFITLGSEGVLVHGADDYGNGLVTDQLPAFNSAPMDVSGAGDCLLISAALSMTSGGSVWEGAYLGSVVAACQVSRVGNTPLTVAEVARELVT